MSDQKDIPDFTRDYIARGGIVITSRHGCVRNPGRPINTSEPTQPMCQPHEVETAMKIIAATNGK